MLQIKKMLININYTKGATITPKYIVIHETANTDRGSNAIANRNYFANHPEAQASAHYIVDDISIIQCLENYQKGWHIGILFGDNVECPDAHNSNAIGIEICVNSDCDYEKAVLNAIELTKYLMNTLNIPAENVITHYMACKKDCPHVMLKNNKWSDFKHQIGGQASNTQITANTSIDTNFIKDIQHKLNTLKISILSEDGIIGNLTTSAIKLFQHITGLTEDGLVGNITKSAIDNILTRPLCKVGSNNTIANRYIQWRVGASIDGDFGQQTASLVALYQSKNGLVNDGIVGNNTWSSFLRT